MHGRTESSRRHRGRRSGLRETSIYPRRRAFRAVAPEWNIFERVPRQRRNAVVAGLAGRTGRLLAAGDGWLSPSLHTEGLGNRLRCSVEPSRGLAGGIGPLVAGSVLNP